MQVNRPTLAVIARDRPPAATDDVREMSASVRAGGRVLRLGVLGLVLAVVLFGFAIRTAVDGGPAGLRVGLWVSAVVLLAMSGAGLRGLLRLAPGEAIVVEFLGTYLGSVRSPGLWWANPWTRRRAVSTKIRTHATPVLKVTDTDGVPIEVAIAVNWRVSDTARALYTVDDFAQFLANQAETALRQIAASHAYEPEGVGAPSLSTAAAGIAEELTGELARRAEPAGITVLDSQIIRLAYAPEIAQAMLRRQQAAAIVAARQQIVDGAVGMVELALQRLEREHIVHLDEERKATMVGNLLVVLCSDHATQPMVNTGSLYL